jgi:hypothetical protein
MLINAYLPFILLIILWQQGTSHPNLLFVKKKKLGNVYFLLLIGNKAEYKSSVSANTSVLPSTYPRGMCGQKLPIFIQIPPNPSANKQQNTDGDFSSHFFSGIFPTKNCTVIFSCLSFS